MRMFTVTITSAVFMLVTPVMAQAPLQVPQSIRVQHEQIISRLDHFAQSKDQESADAAKKAAAFLKEHYAKEEQYVLPTLGLLLSVAKGQVSKEMEPAITMADRTKAALPEFESDHIKITALMNELIAVGKKKKDDELVRLATRVAAQSLNDIEVNQPAAILLGDYLRQRLSPP